MKINFTLVLCLLFKIVVAQENKNINSINDWWINESSDTLPSINLKGVYDYINKNNIKAGKKVIVSFIDTDIDIDHQAFDNLIWTNKDEIPNNNIDDDGNGYVDDLNGWNFIAQKSNGESLDYTLMEKTRILINFSERKLNRLYKKGKILFDYEDVKSSYDETIKSLKEKIKPYADQESNYTEIYNVLKDSFNLEVIKQEDLENLETSSEYLKQCIAYVKYYYDTGFPYNEFIDYLNYKQKSLDICMNLEYDNRELVGDDQNDINDRDYGSPKISGKANSIDHSTKVSGVVVNGLSKFINSNNFSYGIMPIVITGIGDPTDKDTALAIRYAVDNGAKVINLSQTKSFSIHNKFVDDALIYAEKHDVLIVKSAGNENLDLDIETRYPNDTDNSNNEIVSNVITVAASTDQIKDGIVDDSSNYGQNTVDIFAPSTKISTFLPDNKYFTTSGGTSYAAPVVTVVAILIRAYFPDLSASQVKQILMDSGTKYDVDVTITKDNDEEIVKPFSSLSISGKIVNAYNAFLMAEEMSNTN